MIKAEQFITELKWQTKKERAQRATSETGTGFADAKLSEVPPPVAFAPVVGMTELARYSLLWERGIYQRITCS